MYTYKGEKIDLSKYMHSTTKRKANQAKVWDAKLKNLKS